ncbi:Sodium/calcium exchanger protein-domain-containing protein [Scleroderma yunnanense]
MDDHKSAVSGAISTEQPPSDAPLILPGLTSDALRPRSKRTNKSKILTMLVALFQPPKKVGRAPSLWQSLRSIIQASWLNVLLVFIPVSWALHFAVPDKSTLIFIFSFLAIIPLAKLLAFATDELSLRVGQTLAGLMNATLIIALTKCELSIVQSSLIGSILSNLLLVLGMCFFAGGLRFSEQGFGSVAAQLNSSLLTISVIGVLLPGAFHMALQGSQDLDEAVLDQNILKTSHGVAIILLFIYCSYLLFQLFSHKDLYNDDALPKSTEYHGANPFKFKQLRNRLHVSRSNPGLSETERVTSPDPLDHEGSEEIRSGPLRDPEPGRMEIEEEKEEQPQMSVAVSLGLLVAITVLVAITAEFLVDSIDGMTSGGGITKEFVGVILLPIVGNAAEHVTAVTVSVKDKVTLSLAVAVGSSIQIALFVIPFIVTLAWILGKPLTLLFDPLESVVLFLSVLTVNYAIQDGKSNWLEGMILMCLYLILGVTFWFYPGMSYITYLAVENSNAEMT